ncbi:hypothetical protein [Neorhodopirellula lusitana]
MNTNEITRVWQESITISTLGVGSPAPNPMFFDKRVYQGNSSAT